MTSNKKYIQAIIKVPIEVLENGSYETHINYATVDFASLNMLPSEKTSKEDILNKLRLIKQGQIKESVLPTSIITSIPFRKENEEEDTSDSDIISYKSDSSISSSIMDKEDDDESTNSSYHNTSDSSSSSSSNEEDEIESLYSDTPLIEEKTREPIIKEEIKVLDNNKGSQTQRTKEDEINNLMDIFNLFIQPDEISKKNKPKNTSFKKKRRNKSNKRFTARTYGS